MYAVQYTLFRLCWLLLALVGIGRERRFFFVFTIRIGLLCILVTLVYGRQDDGLFRVNIASWVRRERAYAHNRPNLARHGARSIERWTKRVRPGRSPLKDEKSGAEVGLDIRPVLDPFLSFSQAEELARISVKYRRRLGERTVSTSVSLVQSTRSKFPQFLPHRVWDILSMWIGMSAERALALGFQVSEVEKLNVECSAYAAILACFSSKPRSVNPFCVSENWERNK